MDVYQNDVALFFEGEIKDNEIMRINYSHWYVVTSNRVSSKVSTYSLVSKTDLRFECGCLLILTMKGRRGANLA